MRGDIERRYQTGQTSVDSDQFGVYTFKIEVLPSMKSDCPKIVEKTSESNYAGYDVAIGAMSQQIVKTLSEQPKAVSVDTFVYCRDSNANCGYSFSLLY